MFSLGRRMLPAEWYTLTVCPGEYGAAVYVHIAKSFAHHSETRKATLEICYAVILYKVAEYLIQTHKKIHAPSYYGIFPEQDIEFSEVRVDGQYERECP